MREVKGEKLRLLRYHRFCQLWAHSEVVFFFSALSRLSWKSVVLKYVFFYFYLFSFGNYACAWFRFFKLYVQFTKIQTISWGKCFPGGCERPLWESHEAVWPSPWSSFLCGTRLVSGCTAPCGEKWSFCPSACNLQLKTWIIWSPPKS